MGTKNNPGQFDCYANAGPDEPLFILLARDKHAPTLVWLWATLRQLDGEDPAKVQEARDCVAAMLTWQHDNGRKSIGIGQAALAGVLELIRAANMGVKNAPNAKTTEEILRLYLSSTNFEPETRPRAEEQQDRDNDATSDILGMVGIDAPAEVVATWSDADVRAAAEWAALTHLHASDNNDVVVPARPAFLPDPWTGPMQDEGLWAGNPTPMRLPTEA